ncbi:caveolin-3-like [Actinia tenebrosa]|uniref:Caveolin n=1 Tax=Actinia tenebrosa TaxID=6105 RepID=A0A6P8IAB3_ACTTE|nr:caveolin-3-like [Actinia tenebrosa]
MTSQEKMSGGVEGVYDGEDVEIRHETIHPSLRGHHLDMGDRDPTKMNDHVKVFYQDVFAEPDGSYSIDGVWRTSFSTFVATKYWCYRILTAIFGVPTAILCGCYFACLSFDYIWCIMPCLRGYLIELQCLGKVWGLCIRTFCDPLFESLSKILGGIKLTKVKTQEGGAFNA